MFYAVLRLCSNKQATAVDTFYISVHGCVRMLRGMLRASRSEETITNFICIDMGGGDAAKHKVDRQGKTEIA